MNITEPNLDEYSYIIYSKVETKLNTNVVTNSLGYTQEVNSAITMYHAQDRNNTGKNFSNPVLLTLISTCISALPNGGTICLKGLTYNDSLSLPGNISIVSFVNGAETHYPTSSETGSTGAAGATWTTGAGVPSATAAEGDLYLNTTNADVYKMITATWTQIANIKGTSGANGANGDTFLMLDAAGTSFDGSATKYVDAGLVASEAPTQIPVPAACDAISIAAFVITNTLDVGTTIQLRKNGVDLGTPITVATLTSGAMSQAQTVASFAADDLLSVSVVPAALGTSGALTIGKIVITIFS